MTLQIFAGGWFIAWERTYAHKTSFSKDVIRRVDQLLTLNIWVKFSADDIEILFFLIVF